MGEWVNDKKSGYGVKEWNDEIGKVHKGEWFNDTEHGKGVITYADQEMWSEGEFKDGKLHGYGEYNHRNFNYKGMFENGAYDGEGKHLYDNGNAYVGTYKKGL